MRKVCFAILCVIALSCDKNETDPLTTSLNLSTWKIIQADVLEDGVVVQTLTPDDDTKNIELSFVKGGKVYFGNGSCGQWRTNDGRLQFKIYGQQVVPGLCQDSNASKIFTNDSNAQLIEMNLQIEGLGGALSYFENNSEWSDVVQDVAAGDVTLLVSYERVDYAVSPTTDCCAKL